MKIQLNEWLKNQWWKKRKNQEEADEKPGKDPKKKLAAVLN